MTYVNCRGFSKRPLLVQRAMAAVDKISHEFPKHNFGRLSLRIIEQAVMDCVIYDKLSPYAGHCAARYLRGKILHAEICGINSDWIHRVFKMGGLRLTSKGFVLSDEITKKNCTAA